MENDTTKRILKTMKELKEIKSNPLLVDKKKLKEMNKVINTYFPELI